MRKTLPVIALLLLVMMAGIASAASVKVMVDNRLVVFPDQGPYIDKNSRTMVPIRFIAEEMGAEVGWNGKINLVTIKKGNTNIELTIGEKRAKVNGAWKTFDTNAVLHNSRTMVPLRFVSETLGAQVDWDGKTETVYIWTGAGKPAEMGVTSYGTGMPTKTGDWIVSGKPAAKRWDNPVIKYITIDELPHELNSLTVMDISVDDKFVNVKFRTKGNPAVPNMYLAEGNNITRVRNYRNIEVLDDELYIQKYDIYCSFDTAPDLRNMATEADITKITHFIIDGYRNDQTRLLAIENPLYGGK